MEKAVLWSLCVLIVSTPTNGFLEGDPPVQPQCVWYGQCGQGYNRGLLNCPANATTRTPPRMTDPEGLRIIRNYCPALYKGDSSTYTCCSVSQLKKMSSSISLPSIFIKRCPACFYNFLNQICQMTCSPYQAQFIWPDITAPRPHPGTGIPAVTYVMTPGMAQGLYDSCKGVHALFGYALSLMCGQSISKCTPQNWLQYMGSVNNGQAPFPVNYVFQNGKWTSPDQTVLEPLNVHQARCNDVMAGTTLIPHGSCTCRDCNAPSCKPEPDPSTTARQSYFDSIIGSGRYVLAQVTVGRADSKAPVVHTYPPPGVGTINFTSIFDKQFMEQVLLLQHQIANISANQGGQKVMLDDVCITIPGSRDCVVTSVLQYFQNNGSDVDAVAWDQYHFFKMEDYLDHFLTCSADRTVAIDGLPLNMSCLARYGDPTEPYVVLDGYTNKRYQDATEFVLTFLLQNSPDVTAQRDAWITAFSGFMSSYSNVNMTVTYIPTTK